MSNKETVFLCPKCNKNCPALEKHNQDNTITVTCLTCNSTYTFLPIFDKQENIVLHTNLLKDIATSISFVPAEARYEYLKEIKDILPTAISQNPTEVIKIGLSLIKQKEYSIAIIVLSKLVEHSSFSHNKEILLALAAAYHQVGEHHKAIEALKTLEKHDQEAKFITNSQIEIIRTNMNNPKLTINEIMSLKAYLEIFENPDTYCDIISLYITMFNKTKSRTFLDEACEYSRRAITKYNNNIKILETVAGASTINEDKELMKQSISLLEQFSPKSPILKLIINATK